MASRIAVMNKGSIAQLGTPSDLYEFPASRFVADFIGSVNMFEGTLIDDKPDEATVACPELEPHRVHVPHSVAGQEELPVWVAIRPEKMNPAQEFRYAAKGAGVSRRPQCRQGRDQGDFLSRRHFDLSRVAGQRPADPHLATQPLALGPGRVHLGREGLGQLGRNEPGRAPILTPRGFSQENTDITWQIRPSFMSGGWLPCRAASAMRRRSTPSGPRTPRSGARTASAISTSPPASPWSIPATASENRSRPSRSSSSASPTPASRSRPMKTTCALAERLNALAPGRSPAKTMLSPPAPRRSRTPSRSPAPPPAARRHRLLPAASTAAPSWAWR